MTTQAAKAAAARLRRRVALARRLQERLDNAVERAATAEEVAWLRRSLAEAQRGAQQAADDVSAATAAARTKHEQQQKSKKKRQSERSGAAPRKPRPSAAPAKGRQDRPPKLPKSSSTGSDRGLLVDSGVRYSADPDADKRTVWIFKTGSTFHRRDCQIVESRDGAIEIPVAKAKKRNLTRCMHCVPTVR